MNTRLRKTMRPVLALVVAPLALAPLAAPLAHVGVSATGDMVALPVGTIDYRAAGEYLSDGVPVDAPLVATAFDGGVTIMTREVSAAEYARCAGVGACKPVARAAAARDDLPVVGVSFDDAVAYAGWVSTVTGSHYRLPTDAEWADAAGSRFHDDALAVAGDRADPAKRWLAAYAAESAQQNSLGTAPRPFGSFGANQYGLRDVAGNVWEWTATCYVRHAAHTGGAETAVQNCGVHVVEGSHRTYLSDFVRNPRGGACSVGAPPSNLGIRLVRDETGAMTALLRATRTLARSALSGWRSLQHPDTRVSLN